MKARKHRTESDAVRAEVRVWIARRGLSASQVAAQLGHAPSWVSKRIGSGATVPLTVDDLYEFADVLDIPPVALIEPPALPDVSYDRKDRSRRATELMQYRYQSGTIVPDEGTPFPTAA